MILSFSVNCVSVLSSLVCSPVAVLRGDEIEFNGWIISDSNRSTGSDTVKYTAASSLSLLSRFNYPLNYKLSGLLKNLGSKMTQSYIERRCTSVSTGSGSVSADGRSLLTFQGVSTTQVLNPDTDTAIWHNAAFYEVTAGNKINSAASGIYGILSADNSLTGGIPTPPYHSESSYVSPAIYIGDMDYLDGIQIEYSGLADSTDTKSRVSAMVHMVDDIEGASGKIKRNAGFNANLSHANIKSVILANGYTAPTDIHDLGTAVGSNTHMYLAILLETNTLSTDTSEPFTIEVYSYTIYGRRII